jgi:hypothetical protein
MRIKKSVKRKNISVNGFLRKRFMQFLGSVIGVNMFWCVLLPDTENNTIMGRTYSKTEIIEKLKWFHGEEFEKYPLNDNFYEDCYERFPASLSK